MSLVDLSAHLRNRVRSNTCQEHWDDEMQKYILRLSILDLDDVHHNDSVIRIQWSEVSGQGSKFTLAVLF